MATNYEIRGEKDNMEKSAKTTNLDYPTAEMIQREDTIYATFLGAVNTDVVDGVEDLEKIDPRLKVIRIGDAEELHNQGLGDLDLGC
ncbi:hypothetical protein [Stakelama tenebrarum]|uniref:Uncharacterized protein n=1 Tax=Stakelama tenebrarum TaxID=2711215 RepID=A0A6G6Y3I3_9SPHN|nr:hypothetical protein [Sphingosinithalassobacter tenebrarum]QIG79460.1 hypothetical protein G5C33_06440 [Sphingosinithalassobacter tenebrarum]